jgi:hypothetical protein
MFIGQVHGTVNVSRHPAVPLGPCPLAGTMHTSRMPILLNNPAHWHLRAQEGRLLASALEDPEAKAATLKIADEYDRLAVRAAKRIAEADKGTAG